MTTYQTIEERDQVRRKAAVQETCRRVEEAGGPDKLHYAKTLRAVYHERGIRWPEDLPETAPAELPATRVPQTVLKSLVDEVCRRVQAAGGVQKYSYEQAMADVRKERGVPSETSAVITPEAVQAAYRVRNWHPLPESVVDLSRIVRSSDYPMPYRILALSQLRTEQGDDGRPTTEIDVRRFVLRGFC